MTASTSRPGSRTTGNPPPANAVCFFLVSRQSLKGLTKYTGLPLTVRVRCGKDVTQQGRSKIALGTYRLFMHCVG